MNKTSFLEDLFESEIYNILRFNGHSKEYLEMLDNILDVKKKLDALLSGKEKELFSRYTDLQSSYAAENEFESFSQGFRLGASCIFETFVLK